MHKEHYKIYHHLIFKNNCIKKAEFNLENNMTCETEINKAEDLIERGLYSEAKNILESIVLTIPDNLEALNDMAVVNIMEQDYNSAVSNKKKVLAIDKTNEVAEENLKYILSILDDEESLSDSKKEINWETGFTKFCKGAGIEIGSGGKPLPGLQSKQVDLVDDYNGFKYHVDYLSPADDLNFAEDNSLDYIVHSNMLEHLANPVKALLEWHRALKPTGILYMIIPDKRLWITDRQRNVSYPQEWTYAYLENRSNTPSHPNDPNTHFFAYTPNVFKECLAKTSQLDNLFEAVEIYTSSDKVVDEIIRNVNVFVPDGNHMSKNYLAMQNIQQNNGEHKVGHSFHVVLKAIK